MCYVSISLSFRGQLSCKPFTLPIISEAGVVCSLPPPLPRWSCRAAAKLFGAFVLDDASRPQWFPHVREPASQTLSKLRGMVYNFHSFPDTPPTCLLEAHKVMLPVYLGDVSFLNDETRLGLHVAESAAQRSHVATVLRGLWIHLLIAEPQRR